MLRNEGRFEPVDKPLEGPKMIGVGLGCASERHAHSVQRNVMSATEIFQHGEARSAGDHVILCMNFEPKPRRRRGKGLAIMLGLEPNSGGGSHWVTAQPA